MLPKPTSIPARAAVAATLLLWVGCTSISEPPLPPILVFSPDSLELDASYSAQVTLLNAGSLSSGRIELSAGPVQDRTGARVAGVTLDVTPTAISDLGGNRDASVSLALFSSGSLAPGGYDVVLFARGPDGLEGRLLVFFTVEETGGAAVSSVHIGAVPASARTGDVIPLPLEVRDADGELVQGAEVSWSVTPEGAGIVGASGQFVGYTAGPVTVTASAGGASDNAVLTLTERGVGAAFEVVGRGRVLDRFTSDLWLHGTTAYTGTWGGRQVDGALNTGNTLNVWDVSDPAAPALATSLTFDARTVNDVKIRADGRLAVVTHEGSADALNGISILRLDDPLAPVVVSRFTSGLEPGVHNVWIEGDYVYAIVDDADVPLVIVDVSDPTAPRRAGGFAGGAGGMHDVYVRDGLAFLSHWNGGLVILDVGHGIAGGRPDFPREVSRIEDLGGQTHNAWYWPERGYVFVGEEDFGAPGFLRVVDVANLSAPRVVATYRVPGQPPHNFWVDESTATLYAAWYGQGLRAVDVSGELLGELDRQGREIAVSLYNGGTGTCARPSTSTCTWAPQHHNGLVWVSDMNEGLVALRPPR